MSHKIKIALLGVCNSKNMLENKALTDMVENYFFAFQPCFIDITKKNEGLNIPAKCFYETPCIPKKRETANFTKKTMQMDLNKTTLTTLETLNPDYLMVDVSSLYMRHYKITYKNKSVLSVNAYSPGCYEDLQKTLPDLSIEKVRLNDNQIVESLKTLSEYLKNNWDLNKVIIFFYKAPKVYVSDGKVSKYPETSWKMEQYKQIEKSNLLLKSLLPEVKTFNDLKIKISAAHETENSMSPSPFHSNEKSQLLQGMVFKNFLLNKKPSSLDVCIPCHNGEKFLNITIPKIINALKKLDIKWDLHLLCHNSNDNTLNILKSFESNNIHIYEKAYPCTLGEARNFFLENKNINNDFICYVDSDDLVNDSFFLQFQDLNRAMPDENIFICIPFNDGKRTDYKDVPADISEFLNQNIYCEKNEYKLRVTGTFYRKSIVDSNNIRFPLCNIFEGESFNIRYFDCLDNLRSICMLNALYIVGPRGETSNISYDKKKIAFEELSRYKNILKKDESKKVIQAFIDKCSSKVVK